MGKVNTTLLSIDSLMVSGDDKPDTLPEGIHTLVYEAEDEAGNTASWSVLVKAIGEI